MEFGSGNAEVGRMADEGRGKMDEKRKII